MGIEVKYESITKRYFVAKCEVCGVETYSEAVHYSSNQVETIPEREAAKATFMSMLARRGWGALPILCRRCRMDNVIQTVEDMLPGGDRVERCK